MPTATATATATTTTMTTSPAKSRKEKDKERHEKNAQQSTERLKIVVRRLPPNLPEDVFWQTVQQWVSDDTATWRVYHAGKFKKRMNKENIPSRAYIAFKDEDMIIQFSRDFDGHLFKDKAGNESYAIVEYAPHPKVPLEKRKQDSKNNTIEKDEDYISFINSLNAPAGEAVTLESLIAATRAPEPPKTTPLLEALKAEKSAQKDKEAILRNHAHYKDHANVAAIASNPHRKDDKKKANGASAPTPAANQQAKVADAAPLSKKAKKAAAAQAQKAAAAPATKGANDGKVAHTSAKQSKKHAKNAATQAPPAPTAILTAKSAPMPPANAAASSSTAASAAPAATADAPRRARPILGVGRGLEVALAGVGASARARKEKEKERVKEAANVDAKAASAPQPAAKPAPAASASQPPVPPSPARQRNRKGPGAQAATGNAPQVATSASAGPSGNTSKAPAIAQRVGGAPTILTKGNASTGSVPPGTIVPPVGASIDRGRGGGGGGRGRGGRGRGGGGRGGGAPNRGG